VDDTERIIRLAEKIWSRHRQDTTWGGWVVIGEAHVVGRALAMQAAETNRPIGARYNKAMGVWLAEHGFDTMDGGDRKRLFECMANIQEIERWRNTLTATTRLRFNHPKTVLGRWKAATGHKPKRKPGKSLREICNELDAENHRLKQQLAQLPQENRQLKKENTALKAENARLLKRLCPDDWESRSAA